jgi:hypothetical protein
MKRAGKRNEFNEERKSMRKYLILLLISFLSLGLLNCSSSKTKTSKEETRQKADKQSTSNYPDPTDEKGW